MLSKIRTEFDEKYETIVDAMNKFDSMLEQLEIDNARCISDVDNFIAEMKKDDVYTEEIGDFISHYMKYHN